MARTLVALDMDGTLLDHSRLSAGHERAVAELQQQGAEVAIVTGRPLVTVRWIYERLHLRVPLVCCNGGWVGYPDAKPFAEAALSERDVRDIVQVLANAEGTISCYPDADTWLMDRETDMTAHWRSHYQVAIGFARERIHDWRGPSCKVMFVADPERLPGIEHQVRQQFGERFHIVMSEPDRFEISPPGITKAWGLAHLAEHLGIAREQVWAVGDAANDAEMISWAGHGCAMGQAPLAIRARARHILPGVQARGLCALPLLIARSG